MATSVSLPCPASSKIGEPEACTGNRKAPNASSVQHPQRPRSREPAGPLATAFAVPPQPVPRTRSAVGLSAEHLPAILPQALLPQGLSSSANSWRLRGRWRFAASSGCQGAQRLSRPDQNEEAASGLRKLPRRRGRRGHAQGPCGPWGSIRGDTHLTRRYAGPPIAGPAASGRYPAAGVIYP